jgi:imidazolonepropionase-like amidohydrolase
MIRSAAPRFIDVASTLAVMLCAPLRPLRLCGCLVLRCGSRAVSRGIVVASCFALGSAATLAPAQEAPAITFAGVTVLDGAGGVREDATVSVREGKVTFAAIAGGRRVEVKGAYLTPGLVDAASRAGFASAETEPTREMTPDIDAGDLVDPWSRAFRDAARAGCTTAVVVPGPGNVVGGMSRAFRTGGPGGVARPVEGAPQATWLAMSGEASWGNFTMRYGQTESIYVRRPNTRMGVVWMLRQALLDAKSARPDPKLAAYRDVLEGRRACWIFSHRWQDISAALRIADEVGLEPAAIAGAEEAYLGREELARRMIPVVVGPAPPVLRGEGPDATDTALSNAAMLRAAGVRVAITAGPLGGRALRDQAILAVRYGMSRDDALAAVTSVAADLAGLAGRGRIADGAPADLVLWSGHPLAATSRPLVVLVDGEEVPLDAR